MFLIINIALVVQLVPLSPHTWDLESPWFQMWCHVFVCKFSELAIFAVNPQHALRKFRQLESSNCFYRFVDIKEIFSAFLFLDLNQSNIQHVSFICFEYCFPPSAVSFLLLHVAVLCCVPLLPSPWRHPITLFCSSCFHTQTGPWRWKTVSDNFLLISTNFQIAPFLQKYS